MENVSVSKPIRKPSYSDPNVILLGPPGAARKLLFASPCTTSSTNGSPLPSRLNDRAALIDSGKKVRAVQGSVDIPPMKEENMVPKSTNHTAAGNSCSPMVEVETVSLAPITVLEEAPLSSVVSDRVPSPVDLEVNDPVLFAGLVSEVGLIPKRMKMLWWP